MDHVYAWCLWKSKEGARFPGLGIIGSCEPSYEFWKTNLGLL